MALGLIALGIAFTLFIGFALSNNNASGIYRRSALHPVFLVSVFCLIYLLDFLYQASVGVTALRGVTVNFTSIQLSQVLLAHLWIFLGFAVGAALGFAGAERARPFGLPRNVSQASFLAFIVVAVLTTFLYVSSYGLSFGLDEIGANKSLNAGANPILASMFWVVVMSAAICITVERASFMKIAFVTLLAGSIVLSSGARGQLVVLALAFFYALSLHRIKFSRILALFSLIPFAILMSVLRIASRGGVSFNGNIAEYILNRGGILSFLFETDEVSYVEIFSQFVMNDQIPIFRFPFQGLLGVFAVPLPRELFPWKPTPLSTDFTIYWSPAIFANSRSELVVGGFSEAVLEFGVAFAPVIFVLVGYTTVRVFLRSTSGEHSTATWAFFASTAVLFLLRNEFFIMGITAWPALIAVALVLFMSLALRLFGASTNAVSRNAQI